MHTIKINANISAHDYVKKIQAKLGGEISDKNDEFVLLLDGKMGDGKIRITPVQGGVSLIEYDVCFKKDVTIKINTQDLNPLYFFYCLEGEILQRFDEDSKWLNIDDFQSVILYSGPKPSLELCFNKNQKVSLNIIKLNRELFLKHRNYQDFVEEPLKDLFMNKHDDSLTHSGTYNLKIAENIRFFQDINQDGLIRKILVDGQIHFILSLQIQQYLDDLDNNNPYGHISKKQLAKAQELSSFIRENFSAPHRIKSLTARSGLSPGKLQESFKALYNRTVVDYIRNVRLIEAAELIKANELSISEIVYAVGFTSRSYFSKIFKNKYHFSPKEYQDKIRETL
tara:strand:- start:2009 stop:3028 length:1020 start_codon:yes stop_codon:yes gene_type:complete